ncbi:hypothetical protein [Litoribrevibacter albus]|uniref:hypothetical protein n=1 Tax=Litoribrevibacter albus TaxID=1473156 RepID=UPI0024E15801|nr:hypothetical protein [Litoribrevibacter albus]
MTNKTNEPTETGKQTQGSKRACKNCGSPLKHDARLCLKCGIPCPPERDAKGVWLGLDFKTLVILVSIFCLVMIFVLPR